MTELDEKLRAVGAMWGGGDYERIAQTLAPIHERLDERLAPAPGQAWLDVATGTGEMALRAARRGADVTGVDLSERLLDQARAKADAEGLEVEFKLADAQQLPFADASFDGVMSSLGVIFAPDRDAAAGELARVCRPGGRLGLATWFPDEDRDALWAPFVERPPSFDLDFWGEEENVRGLLGGDFDLSIESDEWALVGESGEAMWEMFSEAAPPVRALADSLQPERRAELRSAFIEYYERRRVPEGIRVTRSYLVVLGQRR